MMRSQPQSRRVLNSSSNRLPVCPLEGSEPGRTHHVTKLGRRRGAQPKSRCRRNYFATFFPIAAKPSTPFIHSPPTSALFEDHPTLARSCLSCYFWQSSQFAKMVRFFFILPRVGMEGGREGRSHTTDPSLFLSRAHLPLSHQEGQKTEKTGECVWGLTLCFFDGLVGRRRAHVTGRGGRGG